MKLEDQVISLELAKRLKELGVKQESLFYHLDDRDCEYNECEDCKYKTEILYKFNMDDMFVSVHTDLCSAFTVAELAEMIPWLVEFCKVKNLYRCSMYGQDFGKNNHISMWDTKESDARAKMLIYLIENKIIEV